MHDAEVHEHTASIRWHAVVERLVNPFYCEATWRAAHAPQLVCNCSLEWRQHWSGSLRCSVRAGWCRRSRVGPRRGQCVQLPRCCSKTKTVGHGESGETNQTMTQVRRDVGLDGNSAASAASSVRYRRGIEGQMRLWGRARAGRRAWSPALRQVVEPVEGCVRRPAFSQSVCRLESLPGSRSERCASRRNRGGGDGQGVLCWAIQFSSIPRLRPTHVFASTFTHHPSPPRCRPLPNTCCCFAPAPGPILRLPALLSLRLAPSF